ncbi:hypothetical protein [Acidithiobacillus sp.]|uniref:SLOG domain-containing protein n=1 Tax=Acidithiobacillus sp. TaxID=1872118 RepID=UPI003CFCE253
MDAIFLSASVPVPGRGDYYQSADPFLIQFAVRELITAALGRRLIVWGGHPAITPMVWAACEDLSVDYGHAVVLYQSTFFKDVYPDENKQFGNVEYIDHIESDREGSLQRMREAMISRTDLSAAVFIGGMEGIAAEYDLFVKHHPKTVVIPVTAPGGAVRDLAVKLGVRPEHLEDVDFSRMFHNALGIAPNEPRNTLGGNPVRLRRKP